MKIRGNYFPEKAFLGEKDSQEKDPRRKRFLGEKGS
jgi:hypothetical protein